MRYTRLYKDTQLEPSKSVAPITEEQIILPPEGKVAFKQVVVAPVTASIDSNILAENIKKDVTILGVTGTLESGVGTLGNPLVAETEEAMDTLVSSENWGKIAHYTGPTGKYNQGSFYFIERDIQ